VGAAEVIEADGEGIGVAQVRRAHGVDLLLGGDALAFGAEHDGRTVGVVGADVVALVAARTLEAHPDVRLHLLEHVSQVQRAVGVGQGAGDEYATALHRGRSGLNGGGA
jgi:hypothetical protein